MMFLPAMCISKLLEKAHQIPPTTMIKMDSRKTGRRPIAIAKGMAITLPTPMNSVGYVRRSFAFNSSPGYEARIEVKIGPNPEASTTAEQPYAATRMRIAHLRHDGRFKGSVIPCQPNS